ncbi:glycosyltransferase family 4 protein [Rickettsiales endosymbiont of Stachyamoeba lipophora]|uniref:glycosyltransferase family 4 protein n=1 Tax=Rickettsiales endosymbiont of Stachyamoeba lipophora TaxID=2486578 RepID=UPI000F6506AA|nr:glycosyltransferase family 4 protein [Rickettsiales endosymbiont of Stachyamoeba lipophora]AZL15501.1 glycosyltransferase family 1 protein [Rickettsiales endosymbiont of Stachyamoeba lipophora]
MVKILNCMLSKGLGGIEQAFMDYNEALSQNFAVNSVCHLKSALSLNNNFLTLNSIANWDILASLRLKNIIAQKQIDVCIAHGNRPIALLRRVTKNKLPLIGLAHNYNMKYLKTCDYVITVTNQLRDHIIKQGFNQDKVFHIPNMVKMQEFNPNKKFHSPLVLGSMGRFVAKKGFDLIIQAVHNLQKDGITVKAIIGGAGEEEAKLKQLAKDLNIAELISFPGWINDKEQFFKDIDIFVLPSHHEPFGIVMIESMVRSTPLISSTSEGPYEVIKHRQDGLLFKKASVAELVENIKLLTNNEDLRSSIVNNAYELIQKRFSLDGVAAQLKEVIELIYKDYYHNKL